jgi:hypothetical protein
VDIDVFSSEELDGVFRVLRTALRPSGPLEMPERKFLETYSRIVGRAWQAGSDPSPIRADSMPWSKGAGSRRACSPRAAECG